MGVGAYFPLCKAAELSPPSNAEVKNGGAIFPRPVDINTFRFLEE
jgi:hypothetical protein